MSDKARFFGECPQNPFNGSTQLITVGKSPSPAGLSTITKGVASIAILADTVFTSITFAFPLASAADLSGFTFPKGTMIYGVRSYQVASGTGIAYHSCL